MVHNLVHTWNGTEIEDILVLNVFHVCEHISSPKGIGYPEIQGLLMVLGVLEVRERLTDCCESDPYNLTWLFLKVSFGIHSFNRQKCILEWSPCMG